MSEVEKITMSEARELVANTALWPLVRDFLWDFAPQVHPSWLEGLEAPLSSDVSRIMPSSRARRFVLSTLGVEPCFHAFPKDDWSRIVLLDGATLESIAEWLGALACADKLRGVTDGKTVRALKAALPGVYPEVFSFTAYFTGLDFAAKNAKDAKSPESVVAAGIGLLFALSGAFPAPIADRFRLKFPKNLCDLCVLCGEKERPAAGVAVKKLLKLKFPEAYSLCCS